LEKGNPQSRLGYPSNYGFTVIHETIPRKKGSFSGISIPRFSRAENEASNSIPRIKFNYSNELHEVINRFISKIKACKL
jgi:hypothetical protein